MVHSWLLAGVYARLCKVNTRIAGCSAGRVRSKEECVSGDSCISNAFWLHVNTAPCIACNAGNCLQCESVRFGKRPRCGENDGVVIACLRYIHQFRANQNSTEKACVLARGMAVQQRACADAKQRASESVLMRLLETLQKCAAFRFGEWSSDMASIWFDGRTQDALPPQQFKQLTRHERPPVHDGMVFNQDVLRMRARKNQQTSFTHWCEAGLV